VTFYKNHLVYCTQISYLTFNVHLFQLTFAFYFVFIINVHILFGMCWKRHYDSLCEFVCICIFFMADHIKCQVSITYVLRCCKVKNEYFLMHVIFFFSHFFLHFKCIYYIFKVIFRQLTAFFSSFFLPNILCSF